MIKIITLFSSLLLCFFCCSQPNNNKANNQFVEKFGNNDFSCFANKSFVIRDFDNGDPIVFVYNYSTSTPCGFIKIIVSSKSKALREITAVEQKDSCKLEFNKTEYYNLVLEFLKLNINMLYVDSDKNVFVKVTSFEGKPNLIRINSK